MPFLDPWEHVSELARAATAMRREQDRLADELERLGRDGISISRHKNQELADQVDGMIRDAWLAVGEADRKGSHI